MLPPYYKKIHNGFPAAAAIAESCGKENGEKEEITITPVGTVHIPVSMVRLAGVSGENGQAYFGRHTKTWYYYG